VLSTLFHVVVFVFLGLCFRFAPQGAATEPDRQGGIVLVQSSAGKTTYFDEGDAGDSSDSRQNQANNSPASSGGALPDENDLPPDLEGILPRPGTRLGNGDSLLPDAGSLTQGVGPGTKIGGQVQTSVFGVQGTGTKFVYVFDRSGSMEGYQGRPLAAAKRELIQSLDHLEAIHQFQVIFYNERPHVLNPLNRKSPPLMYGDERDKKLALKFINGIVASGATHHMVPLRMAINMRPDVIFLLTDAAEPQLSDEQLAILHKINRSGTIINTIEFGSGPPQGGDNFLKKLALQNGGQYHYQDITILPPR